MKHWAGKSKYKIIKGRWRTFFLFLDFRIKHWKKNFIQLMEFTAIK